MKFKNLKKKITSLGLVATILGVSLTNSFAATKQDMKIEFINVGAGDAIYIETPSGADILIDAGTTGNGKKVVDCLLKQEKNMDLEYVISTHPDADHVGGLQEVFKKMKVEKFYYPKDTSYTTKTAKAVLNLAKKEKGCKIYDSKTGTKIKSGGAILQFVHSSKNYSGDNEDSVMTYIDYGNLEVLLTGDAENGAENAGKKYNVDILQVPHHGSKSSSNSAFIKKYDPEKIIVSTDGKKYGHPHAETFKRYASYDKNIDVYRTDKTGNIIVKANGTKWWVDKNDKPVKVTKYSGTTSTTTGTSTKPSKTVYCNGGSSSSNKYHKSATAHGMKDAIKMAESEAKKKGYVACKTCY